MTKPPGLTEAMRRALENARDHGDSSYRIKGRSESGGHSRVVFALVSRGLLDERGSITPRGQAALAAPRVTEAELAMLELIERGGTPDRIDRVVYALMDKGWMVAGKLSDAGTTALNNVRAASGSPDYKETT